MADLVRNYGATLGLHHVSGKPSVKKFAWKIAALSRQRVVVVGGGWNRVQISPHSWTELQWENEMVRQVKVVTVRRIAGVETRLGRITARIDVAKRPAGEWRVDGGAQVRLLIELDGAGRVGRLRGKAISWLAGILCI